MANDVAATSDELQAYITPRLLRWARLRSRETVPALAWKLRVDTDKIHAWESEKSDEKPSFIQAKKIAKTLHVPFGYLYLSNPPSDELPIPDLRTVATNQRTPLSPSFMEVLNDALRKQDWYREFRKSQGEEKLPFVGRYDMKTNPDVVAADIASTIGIDDALRFEVANWEGFLSQFIDRCERQNILVLRNSVVKNDNRRHLSEKEFRGFAISDAFAPLIFLNGSDARAAQIFTLAHELVHLWIGQSGISNLVLTSKRSNPEIEKYCNAVAAEILVPRDLFNIHWVINKSAEKNLAPLSKRFRVSNLVILKRAYDFGHISWDVYVRLYRQHERRYANKNDGGPGFYAVIAGRSSKRLMANLLASVMEGKTTYRDGAAILAVNPAYLRKIVSNQNSRR